MSESYPDIEIYIKDVSSGAIIEWLRQHFCIESTAPKLLLTRQGQSVECLIVADAVMAAGDKDSGENFTSVWFKSNQTPWASDLDCARDAFQFLSLEVRCSTGSWEQDKGGWVKIDQHGETAISWD